MSLLKAEARALWQCRRCAHQSGQRIGACTVGGNWKDLICEKLQGAWTFSREIATASGELTWGAGRTKATLGRRHFVIAAGVLLLHGLGLWALLSCLAVTRVQQAETSFHLSLISNQTSPQRLPPVHPVLQSLASAIVPAPQIEIAPQGTSIAAMSDSSPDILAPRPDPAHLNARPILPPDVQDPKAGPGVTLHILVRADGSVGDARVSRSSGKSTLDNLIMEFVKANWHYLPASIAGRTIQYWTTVLVPLGA